MPRTSFHTVVIAPLACTLLVLAGTLTGCATNAKPEASPPTAPITPAALESIRTEFTESDPGVKLALVGEVLPAGQGDNLRVTDALATDFPARATVLIIDANKDALAHGVVYAVLDGYVDVKFQPIAGKRRPAVGDAVVKFSRPAM